MSRAQVQENARAWAAETEGLAGLAQAATEGNSLRFRRVLAAVNAGTAGTSTAQVEGIEQEADYVDNWLEREDYFGMHDGRTNPYANL